jgi:hypothetical protein
MNAKDFRIGNIVQSDGKILIIDRIVSGNIDKVQAGAVGFYLNNCEPEDIFVALTPEWLERLGWRYYNGKNDGDMTMDTNVKIDIDFIDGVIMIKSHYEGHSHYRAMPWVKNVHQLQNMFFALSGEELEIKNK